MPGKPSHKSLINYLLDAVSVCLLLISLAALFFAVGKSGQTKNKPEAAKTSVDNNKRYVTKNIEDIRIGERTLGTNPQGRLESELDESVFRTVPHCGYALCYTAENGSRCDIRLLRPADWLDWELTRLCRASDGKAVDAIDLVSEDLASGGFDVLPDYELETWIELPEMGVVGWARVTDVDADVEIESGAGNIVTGVFAHTVSSTLDLTVEGQTAPIGCTANHPFWSVDRQEFVSAGELREGELLALYSGETKRVVQKLPRPGPEVVYNLEVYGEHAYCVTSDGLLVHNDCTRKLRKNMEKAGVFNPKREAAKGDKKVLRFAAHHIVCRKDTPNAFNVLQQYGVDIDSFYNGVYLPMRKNTIYGSAHISRHGSGYKRSIERIFDPDQISSRQDVLTRLHFLRQGLSAGTIKLTGPEEFYIDFQTRSIRYF